MNASPAPILAMRSVSKSFGGLRVLEEVTLAIAAGERRAIIGPNGAGKTTLFHIMSGLLAPSAGSIELYGSDITRFAVHQRAALGMARTFQLTTLFPNLTVLENVLLALHGLSRSKFALLKPMSGYRALIERAGELLEQWRLAEHANRLVRELAYGEQRALEILLAVCQQPKLLLLDEPTAGLSPAETTVAVEIIQSLPRQLSIVLIEHDMDVAFRLCEAVTVLHAGKVVASGTAESVRRDPDVKAIYLGD